MAQQKRLAVSRPDVAHRSRLPTDVVHDVTVLKRSEEVF